MTNDTPVSTEPTKSGSGKMVAIAAVLGVALAGGNIYLMNRTNTLESQIKDMRSTVKTELVSLQEHTDSTAAKSGEQFAALEAKINESGMRSSKEMTQAMSRANLNTKKASDLWAKKLEEQQQQAEEQHKTLTSQLGELQQDTSTKVTGIATEVTGVKTDVAQTKSDLEKTIGDLKSTRGDLGVQSGLIATNSKELQALRALGERDYVEFQLPKSKNPQKIGDVALQLKRSDSKRNRYTIELIANDKRVEKRDKSVNEPVQFYMASARIPYEIVINEVRNDKIVGYLSAPKIRNPR